jgi:hypothetical protein
LYKKKRLQQNKFQVDMFGSLQQPRLRSCQGYRGYKYFDQEQKMYQLNKAVEPQYYCI